MGKYLITTSPENCSGCSRCQLACSEANSRRFRPFEAFIRVEMAHTGCIINFTGDCIECGICVDNCFYGALTKIVKEESE